MPIESSESMNATLQKLLRAITEVDVPKIEACCRADVILQVSGARAVDLTRESRGVNELAAWAKGVHELCGLTRFVLHRYFENGCETMGSGEIQIERLPRHFSSPCSIHVRFEAGRMLRFNFFLIRTASKSLEARWIRHWYGCTGLLVLVHQKTTTHVQAGLDAYKLTEAIALATDLVTGSARTDPSMK